MNTQQGSMYSAFELSATVDRFHRIQSLCVDGGAGALDGVLFVPGADAKFNRGSQTAMRYLFLGCAGHELEQPELPAECEPLEDCIVLITKRAIGIYYTSMAADQVQPVLHALQSTGGYPFPDGRQTTVVEFCPTAEELVDVEKLQWRKVHDFRAMLRQLLPESGASVGVPLPIGFDSVTEIDTWALVQSVALEDPSLGPSFGFFSARFRVVDISVHMRNAFRACDPLAAVNVLHGARFTLGPAVQSALDVLTAGDSAERRLAVTEEACAEPFTTLRDFSMLQSQHLTDTPDTVPRVFLGMRTQRIDTAMENIAESAPNSTATVGDTGPCPGCPATHCIVEASEPSTGAKVCRTFFLLAGRQLPRLRDLSALVIEGRAHDGPPRDEEEKHEGSTPHIQDVDRKLVGALTVRVRPTNSKRARASWIDRLQCLYIALCACLRESAAQSLSHVHAPEGEASFRDLVLSVAGIMQSQIESTMRHAGSSNIREDSGALDLRRWLPNWIAREARIADPEVLRVHIDCMDSFGRIVSVDEAAEMGGSCLLYIRLSLEGIAIPPKLQAKAGGGGGDSTVSVAVGDTFVFSADSAQADRAPVITAQGQDDLPPWGRDDAVCVTGNAVAPYVWVCRGAGAEDSASATLLHLAHDMHLSRDVLRLGYPVMNTGSRATGADAVPLTVRVSLLAGHRVWCDPTEAELQAFDRGFLLHHWGGGLCALPVAFDIHLERVTTIVTENNVTILVLRMRDHHERSKSHARDAGGKKKEQDGETPAEDEDEEAQLAEKSLEMISFNPLTACLPLSDTTTTEFAIVLEPRAALAGTSRGGSGSGRDDGGGVRTIHDLKHLRSSSSSSSTLLGVLEAWKHVWRQADVETSTDASDLSKAMQTSLERYRVKCESEQVRSTDNSEHQHQHQHPLQTFKRWLDTVMATDRFQQAPFGVYDEFDPTALPLATATHLLHGSMRARTKPTGSRTVVDAATESPTRRRVLAFVGVPGSGVVDVATTVARHLGDGSGDFAAVHCPLHTVQLVPSADSDISAAEVHESLSRSFLSSSDGVADANATRDSEDVAILCVVGDVSTCALHTAFQQADLSDTVELSTVVGVISSSAFAVGPAFASADTDPEVTHPRAMRHAALAQQCAIGFTDTVLLVDRVQDGVEQGRQGADAVDAFRTMLRRCNPGCRVERAPARSVWSPETLDDIVRPLFEARGHSSSAGEQVQARRRAANWLLGRDWASARLNGSISEETGRTPSLFGRWTPCDLDVCVLSDGDASLPVDRVLQIAQAVFPHAKPRTLEERHIWHWDRTMVPQTGMRGFTRVLEIAKHQVMSTLAHEEGNDALAAMLKSGLQDSALQQALSCAAALFGIVSVSESATPGGGVTHVLVEANPSDIAVRPLPPALSWLHVSGALHMSLARQGSVEKQTRLSLRVLGQAAAQSLGAFVRRALAESTALSLTRLPVRRNDDVSDEERREVNRRAIRKGAELPSGWWYDGSRFVDYTGAAQTDHPDLDALVEQYLEMKNAKARAYNTMVDEWEHSNA